MPSLELEFTHTSVVTDSLPICRKVLVVDDDVNNKRLAQITLLHEGYAVPTAANGREALHCVACDPPDLIVLDIMMPELNGIEVLKSLKSDKVTAHIPVILLSANAQESDIAEGHEAGAHAYMTKPYELCALVRMIQGIFE